MVVADDSMTVMITDLSLPPPQYPENRSYKGDFVIGLFFLRELWNPLQNLAQILKLVIIGCSHTECFQSLYKLAVIENVSADSTGVYMYTPLTSMFADNCHSFSLYIQLQMQSTILYFMNGVALVLVQLVVRVLNWPIVVLIYAAQYHAWDVWASLHDLYLLCFVCTITWQVLELYWFWMIVQLVAGFTKSSKKKTT